MCVPELGNERILHQNRNWGALRHPPTFELAHAVGDVGLQKRTTRFRY